LSEVVLAQLAVDLFELLLIELLTARAQPKSIKVEANA
jgi:hypothetical protein